MRLDFALIFFAEGVNEITLRPRHASPISTHIVETDHPPYAFIKKRRPERFPYPYLDGTAPLSNG